MTRSVRRRLTRRQVATDHRVAAARRPQVQLSFTSGGVTQSFLIMDGDTATVGLSGYAQGWDRLMVTMPVTVSARIA